MKNFSPEDLLEYHYGEMPTEQRLELQEMLKHNWSLREKMEVIREAAQRLEKSLESPRQEVVNTIMDYAASHLTATTI